MPPPGAARNAHGAGAGAARRVLLPAPRAACLLCRHRVTRAGAGAAASACGVRRPPRRRTSRPAPMSRAGVSTLLRIAARRAACRCRRRAPRHHSPTQTACLMMLLFWARSAQRRRSQPAFIIIMIMKLVSMCAPDFKTAGALSLPRRRVPLWRHRPPAAIVRARATRHSAGPGRAGPSRAWDAQPGGERHATGSADHLTGLRRLAPGRRGREGRRCAPRASRAASSANHLIISTGRNGGGGAARRRSRGGLAGEGGRGGGAEEAAQP
jgi:hypothetical protein